VAETIGNSRWRGAVVGVLAAALIALCAGQARAAVYPAGGSSFTGGPEGWQVSAASCNVAVLCTAEGGYDAAEGNPAGSLTAKSNITLNLVSAFKATVTEVSPEFKASTGGPATLHIDRQFVPANLVGLEPEATYTVKLIDKTAATESTPIVENVKAASAWSGVDAATSLKEGHAYEISVTTETASTVVGTGLLAGATNARIDNVQLFDRLSGGGGGGAGAGSGAQGGNSLTDAQLTALMRSSLVGPAVLKGKRLFVKAKCPVKVGVKCKVSVQGLLKKRKPATSTRTASVGKGKTKRFVLQVRPKARATLATRKRLLFKETIKAGLAKAIVYKSLKLVKR
jgi:hypothetical protein